MSTIRKIEALEVLEAPYRVVARLECGHVVLSWRGAYIGALRRCRECERAQTPPAGAVAGCSKQGERT